ncbi:MAG: hypothetical protein HZA50_05245 [Planctomycetes bacterium]|nr:hypothetical protein [Planctomycetota bacterium]
MKGESDMCNLKRIFAAACLLVSLAVLPVLAGCQESETVIHKEKSSTPTEQTERTEHYHK